MSAATAPAQWIGPRPFTLDWRNLYLRLSVTDACNFRCQYCRPVLEDTVQEQGLLSFEEIHRLVGWCYRRGSRKVRLTGGEPLLRKNLPELVGILKRDYPRLDLSLSTNGLLLSPLARDFRKAGLDRVNISLDTLDPEKFRNVTGVDGLEKVLRAISACHDAGLFPVKLNVVLLRGTNEDELCDLVRYAFSHGLYLRFIEYMPHCKTETNRFTPFSSAEALEILSREFSLSPLEDSKRPVGSGPARYWKVDGSDLPIGLISSVTQDICQDCSRLRLTARGELVRCIQLDHFQPVRDLIREGREEVFCSQLEQAYEQRDHSRAPGHVFFLGTQLIRTGG
jgi:cyclic pyranopterin phosphate synthase